MALTSTLFTGLSGLDVNQTRLNVVGNITAPLGTTTVARATTKAQMEGNLNANGPVGSGASILTSQLLTTVGGLAQPNGATLLTNLASTTTPATPLMANGDVFTLQG